MNGIGKSLSSHKDHFRQESLEQTVTFSDWTNVTNIAYFFAQIELYQKQKSVPSTEKKNQMAVKIFKKREQRIDQVWSGRDHCSQAS